MKYRKIRMHNGLPIVGISLFWLTACSTIQIHSDNSIIPSPYLGTKYAAIKTLRYWKNYDFYGQVVLVALDVPLCLVADTLLLPYDIYQSLSADTSH